MDIVKFFEEMDRMCKYEKEHGISTKNEPCPCCPIPERLNIRTCPSCADFVWQHPAEAVEIVERWAKEHPRKTRQSEFLKMFPRAEKLSDGILSFCPENMDAKLECPERVKNLRGECACSECRKKYWLEEVEE